MGYKLLVYSADYGDEFDVNAQAIMTDGEYLAYRNRPAGIPNKDYEKELEEYNIKEKLYQEYSDELTKRELWLKKPADYTDGDKEFLEKYKDISNRYSYNAPTKLKRSFMNAYLGNYGDCFEEDFMDYLTMGEIIDEFADVYDVSEDFIETFIRCDLGRCTMCNIFELDEDDSNWSDDE